MSLVKLVNLQEKEEKTYFALNNPLRSWIIELLQSYKALTLSDLAGFLHISLGRCCYHLDNLNGLVKQDKQQRYFLSDDGLQAYNSFVEPRNSIKNIVQIMK